MARDIQQFLREAAARRQSTQPVHSDDLEVVEIIDDEDEKVRLLVNENTGSSRLGQDKARPKNEDIAARQAAQIDANVHAHLDHDICAVDGIQDYVADDQVSATNTYNAMTEDIVHMLRNPASVRQAVILSEVLARPDYRW